MNPYVYSRSKKVLAAAQGQPPSPVLLLPGLVKSVLTASVSSAMAFAIVILAAGSVASMTALAYSDVSQGGEPVVVHSFAFQPKSMVLGDSTTVPANVTIDDSSLEAAIAVSGKVTAKPLSYDATLGRWDYAVSYAVSNFTGSASLSVGTYVVQSGITTSGSSETGTILKPGTLYHVTLWLNDQSGNPLSALRYDLKTPKAKASSDDSQGKSQVCAQLMASPQSGTVSTSTTTGLSLANTPNICIKKDDGSMLCKPLACISVPKQWQGYLEGNKNASSTPPIGMQSKGSGISTPMQGHEHEHQNEKDGHPQLGQFATGKPGNLPPPPKK
jgi:LysM repeat protein